LTVSLHTRNRLYQSALLQQQSLILRNIIDPIPPPPPTSAREARVSVFESAKDSWNAQIEGLVRKMQDTNWGIVRERVERGASEVLGAVGGSVPEKVQDGVQEGIREVQESVQEGMRGERILEKVARGKEV
jgi:altered-inheritance-of-mitochondria protein 5